MCITTACPDPFDDIPKYFDIDKTYIEFGSEGGTDTIWLKEKDAIWWMTYLSIWGTYPSDSIEYIIYNKTPDVYRVTRNNAYDLIVTDSLNFSRDWFSLTIPSEEQNYLIVKCATNDSIERNLYLSLSIGDDNRIGVVEIKQEGSIATYNL